jgi:hypothetical protein
MKSLSLLFIVSVIFANALAGPPGRRTNGFTDALKSVGKAGAAVLGGIREGASAVIAPALGQSRKRRTGILDLIDGVRNIVAPAQPKSKTRRILQNNRIGRRTGILDAATAKAKALLIEKAGALAATGAKTAIDALKKQVGGRRTGVIQDATAKAKAVIAEKAKAIAATAAQTAIDALKKQVGGRRMLQNNRVDNL